MSEVHKLEGSPFLKVNPAGISFQTKNLNRWVVWRGQEKASGKYDKRPVDPLTGRPQKWGDPDSWMTFDEAMRHYQSRKFDGVGIVLSDQHPIKVDGNNYFLVALDYDNVSGQTMPAIQEEWLSLGKPHLELSPSGKGLHMFALSDRPLKGGNNGHGREMYSSGRFITVTGQSAKGSLKVASEQLAALEQKWFPARSPRVAVKPDAKQGVPVAPIGDRARLTEALSYISPDCSYEQWRNVVWAILSTSWEDAVETAREWSMQVETIPGAAHTFDEVAFDTTVRSFDAGKGITVGTLYHYAKLAGWPSSVRGGPYEGLDLHQSANEAGKRGRLLTPAELKGTPDEPWRIEGLLPQRGSAAIFGESGSGKTFLVLDLMYALASGQPEWSGQRVASCAVVYVPLEGRGGLKRRLMALEANKQAEAPASLRTWSGNLSLLDQDQVVQFAAIVAAELGTGCVVVIDTLNQASPGADENSSSDMGKIISNTKLLSDLIQGLVILIHHSGKDRAKGLRGHSSLIAALDTAIEVSKGDAGRSWRLAKAKDFEDGVIRYFDLKSYVVDDTEQGVITSCAVVPALHDSGKPARQPRGKNQVICMAALADMLRRKVDGVPTSVAVDTAAAALDCPAGRRKAVAKAVIDSLVQNGNLIRTEGGVALP